MRFNSVELVYFSPTGGTRRIVEWIGRALQKATPDGKDKIVTTRGEVVSCEIVPGANATDAGYRPHWATCPQAGRFKRGGRHHE